MKRRNFVSGVAAAAAAVLNPLRGIAAPQPLKKAELAGHLCEVLNNDDGSIELVTRADDWVLDSSTGLLKHQIRCPQTPKVPDEKKAECWCGCDGQDQILAQACCKTCTHPADRYLCPCRSSEDAREADRHLEVCDGLRDGLAEAREADRLAGHLDALCEAFHGEPGYFAGIEGCWSDEVHGTLEMPNKNDYLLRYGKWQGADEHYINTLVVMGDLGTTWEPWGVCSTEERAEITGIDLKADLETLKADADDWYFDQECSLREEEES